MGIAGELLDGLRFSSLSSFGADVKGDEAIASTEAILCEELSTELELVAPFTDLFLSTAPLLVVVLATLDWSFLERVEGLDDFFVS